MKFGKAESTTVEPATIRIYKIAQHLDLYLSDFIDCTEDLEKMIELLPAQQYGPLLSKLAENMYTADCKESIMDQRGDRAQIRTVIKSTGAIMQNHLDG